MSDRKTNGSIFRGRVAAALLAGLGLITVCAAARPAAAQKNPARAAQKSATGSAPPATNRPAAANAAEDFYIIISVNESQNSLVLKLPTEVTTIMTVNAQTTYLDENGKRIGLADLHAGDTVYLIHRHAGNGEEIAVRIRKGPMTLAELHRRFLTFR
jgi:hypothetical protein